VAVALDADLRALTERVAAETRAMVAAGRTPAAVYEARRCDACSLLELCRPRPSGKRRSAAAWLGRRIGEEGP
jgi:CRISPR-associated exonuclease Cas4